MLKNLKWILLLAFLITTIFLYGCGNNEYEDVKTGMTIRELGSDLDNRWAFNGVVVELVKPGSKTAGVINAGELISYIVDERKVKSEKDYRKALADALEKDKRAILGILKSIPNGNNEDIGIQVKSDLEERGALVDSVKAGGKADIAGIRIGAIVNGINGKAVKTTDEYNTAMTEALGGSGTITLSILREISAPKFREVGIDELTSQSDGAKVTKMENKPEGTPASMEGIMVGDVITSVIDEMKITNIKSYKKALKKASDADRVIFKRGELGGIKLVVIEALGKINDPKAVEPLLKALNSEDRWIRRSAAVAMEKMNDERVIQPLMWHLLEQNEPDSEVRRSAAKALARMRRNDSIDYLAQALKDSLLGVRLEASYALAKIGEPAINVLIQASNDPDSKVRDSAVAALGNIGSRQARDELIKVLNNANEESTVKLTAIQALSKIGDPESMGELRRLVNSGDPGLRAFIKEILTDESS
jgi:HEAT repeat protein